jgi:hypothetical protein
MESSQTVMTLSIVTAHPPAWIHNPEQADWIVIQGRTWYPQRRDGR